MVRCRVLEVLNALCDRHGDRDKFITKEAKIDNIN